MPGSGQIHWGQSGKFLAVTKSVMALVCSTDESIGLEAFVAAPVGTQQQVTGNSLATPPSDTHQSPDVLPAVAAPVANQQQVTGDSLATPPLRYPPIPGYLASGQRQRGFLDDQAHRYGYQSDGRR